MSTTVTLHILFTKVARVCST